MDTKAGLLCGGGMIDDATLAQKEKWFERLGDPWLRHYREAISEIRRLREELAQEPTREWYEKRCAWYGDELDRLKADLAAHQAEIRQLREECGRRGGMSNPHLEAISWCCDEHRQKSANEWIAHRAVVRELVNATEQFLAKGDDYKADLLNALTLSLVQQAREGRDE